MIQNNESCFIIELLSRHETAVTLSIESGENEIPFDHRRKRISV